MTSSPAPLSPAHLSRRQRQRAFTLVELLMVIVIIGILVALVSFAAVRAITAGRQTAVMTEISQLSMALESYKQKHGSYPPNPGTEPGIESAAQREQRFIRHIRRAFPRYTGNLAQLRTDLQNATDQTDPDHPTAFNIDTMDGAEALVFFLGGIPNRSSSNPCSGFAADPARPFTRSTQHPDDPDMMGVFVFGQPQQQRTTRFFDFDPTRLVDRDGDGWLEYVPDVKTSVLETAPYAYFDAGSYHLGPHYPIAHHDQPTQDRLAGLWGFAVPYGRTFVVQASGTASDPADWDVTVWQEPDKFQIICAGMDGQFGGRPDPISTYDEEWKRIFPTGEGYKNFNGGAPPAGYIDLDSDNMTNFAEKPIGEVEAPTSP